MKDIPESYVVNKVVLITGASSGIGVASALAFARHGARLVLAASKTDRLQGLAEQIIAAGGQAMVVPVDITNPVQIRELIDQALVEYNRIDVLIANSGWCLPAWYEDLTPQDLRRHFEENVLGMAELIRETIPVMKKQHSGNILNLVSYTSQFAIPSLTTFSGTSYALEGLTDGLRRELAPWGIKVTRVHVGNMTRASKDTNGKQKEAKAVFPRGEESVDEVALELVNAVERPRRAIYIGSMNSFLVGMNRRFPALMDTYTERWVRQKRDRELREAAGKKPIGLLARIAPAAILTTAALAGFFAMRNGLAHRRSH